MIQEDPTDADLVMLARADDTDAFTLLIERYQVMLTYIALSRVDNEEIAHEIVQEALLHAYLSLDQLRDAAHFKNWLYGIVLNLCRNWVRTYKGRARAPTMSLDQESLLTHYDDILSPDPQELIVEQELQHLVRKALQLLSPKNRMVMQLFYYEGLSLGQIAHHQNISLAAVKSRMFKGRDQLRAHLKMLYPELAEEMPTRKERHTYMVTVTLAKVLRRLETHPRRTILVLLDEQHQRALPLWFSDGQSHWSGRVLPVPQEKEIPLEPLTMDFLAQILSASETTVEEIAIDALRRESLYARVKVRSMNTTQIVKAHLNDALPLALRLNCPLAVSEDVLTTMGIQLADWGKTLEQQIDTVTDLAAKTPVVMNYQGALHSAVPRNLNFEDGLHGWHFSGHSAGPTREYGAQLDTQTIYSNKNSLAITVQKAETSEMTGSREAQLIHEGFLADSYRGQRLRMITHIKAQEVSSASFAIMVVGIELTPEQERTKAKTHIILTQDRAFEGTHDWRRCEQVFNVPDDATSIQACFKMQDQGKVWIDGFQFERVEKSVHVTGTQQFLPPLQYPHNLDFAQDLENWCMVGGFTQDYICGIDHMATAGGTACAYLKVDKPEPRGSVAFMQRISDENYRNKRVRFSAAIKTVGVTQQAGLSIKAGSRDKTIQKETSIKGDNDWKNYDIIFDVPDEKPSVIDFGLTLQGRGQIWLQDVRLEIVTKTV